MTLETFKSRKAFLSNFLKEKVEFQNSECDFPINETVFRTNYFNPEVYTPDFISEKIRPFYYYILSYFEKHAQPSDITFKLKPLINDYEDTNNDFTHCDFYCPDTAFTLKGIAHFDYSIFLIKEEGFITIPFYPFFFEIRIIEEAVPINKIRKTFKTDECVICLSSSPNIIYTDCGHISTCESCELKKEITICPTCRTSTKTSKIQI